MTTAARRPDEATAARALRVAAADDEARLWVRLAAGPQGLPAAEAMARLQRHGPNRLTSGRARAPLTHLWACWATPFNLLLSAVAGLSLLLGQLAAALIIAVIVALATGLRYAVEARNRREVLRLQALVSAPVRVLRPDADGHTRRSAVPTEQLVPGDVLLLRSGDRVPADCRVLAAEGLLVDQAALSGEAEPVPKQARPDGGAMGEPPAWPHMVYAGTGVLAGHATALVVATGAGTLLGAMAQRVAAARARPTAFGRSVDGVTTLLLQVAVLLVLLVLLLHGALAGGGWAQTLLFALAVAVGLVPELLPALAATTLARGARVMHREQVLVRDLDAVQNLGAMQVLCADKTGTLTQGRMALRHATDATLQPDDTALRWAALAAARQTGRHHPLDQALAQALDTLPDPAPEAGARAEGIAAAAHPPLNRLQGEAEWPADERTRMTLIRLGEAPGTAAAAAPGRRVLVAKGDPDTLLPRCVAQRRGGSVQALDAAARVQVARRVAGWAVDGLRVLAVAVCDDAAPDDPGHPLHRAQAPAWTLLGFVAYADPVRPEAAGAAASLAARGVQLKLLTGDDPRVARAVCREMGLPFHGLTLGPRIDRMSDAQLARVARRHTVFARLTPAHKARLVQALRSPAPGLAQAQPLVVGFIGDGVNDAPALRAADIGIAVQDALPVAQEAADVVMRQRGLHLLDAAVLAGRRAHANLLKYLRMALSANFGNVLSVVLASLFLPFLPMLPLQLLVQNLLYDLSQLALPWDRVDEELLARPVRLEAPPLGRFIGVFGPVSTVFDLAAFAALWWLFGLSSPAQAAAFHGAWFAWGLLSQTLVVHLIRTPRLPFVHSRPAPVLLAATLAVAALALWLPWGPLGALLGLQAPPSGWGAFLAGLLLAYGLAVGTAKAVYLRRFGWQ